MSFFYNASHYMKVKALMEGFFYAMPYLFTNENHQYQNKSKLEVLAEVLSKHFLSFKKYPVHYT